MTLVLTPKFTFSMLTTSYTKTAKIPCLVSPTEMGFNMQKTPMPSMKATADLIHTTPALGPNWPGISPNKIQLYYLPYCST
jgi:hypothetical protein